MARITREIETRAHEMRDTYDMDYISPLTIPHGVKKDGYSYRWVNTDIKGAETYQVETRGAQGWTLVPADRAPSYCFDPLNRNPTFKDYIRHKDVVLMECPDEIVKRSTEALHRFNDQRIKSLKGVSNDIGSFSKPLNSINSF
jgi:hypothetical protein